MEKHVNHLELGMQHSPTKCPEKQKTTNIFSILLYTYMCSSSLKVSFPIHSVLLPWDEGGGIIFVSSTRQGATVKLQEPGWGHIQGVKMVLCSQAGGADCFIMTKCWYFHKMLHLEFYKFHLLRYLIFF